MLVVCTARPELLARRPGWGGGKPNASTISLSPLSDDDTARLVHALLERSVLPADVQAALIERAGGNPLYAEEFARMVDELSGRERLRLPESVQGSSPRGSTHFPSTRSSCSRTQRSSGRSSGSALWRRSAVATARESELLLHGLERKEFVRRERRSSVAEESQYVFSHLLVQDVAYSQIPRARPLGEASERRHGSSRSAVPTITRRCSRTTT